MPMNTQYTGTILVVLCTGAGTGDFMNKELNNIDEDLLYTD